jgi:hypothetical protein
VPRSSALSRREERGGGTKETMTLFNDVPDQVIIALQDLTFFEIRKLAIYAHLEAQGTQEAAAISLGVCRRTIYRCLAKDLTPDERMDVDAVTVNREGPGRFRRTRFNNKDLVEQQRAKKERAKRAEGGKRNVFKKKSGGGR